MTATDSYLEFTETFNQLQVQEEDHTIRVPEKVIRCIWNDQLFCTCSLRTSDDRNLEIVYPGYWNFGKGPDFTNATIKVNGKVYEGDVELHVYSTDWKTHGHSRNPDFDNVILHVYMWQGRGQNPGPIEKQDGLPFQFEIKNYLTKGILELNNELDFEKYPTLNSSNVGLCHKPLAQLPKEKLSQLLDAAGEARLSTKMERFHDSVIIEGYEQTFYRGVAEALGYPENKKPFQMLADALPLIELKSLVPANIPKKEKVLHYEALLFGVSGLMDEESGGKAGFKKLMPVWKFYQDKVHPLNKESWSFRAIRPANYPYRRMAGLAHLIAHHDKAGMFADFIGSYQKILITCGRETPDKKTLNSFNDFFCVSANDYWAKHYIPDGKTLSHSQQLIGQARSREIIINIGLPIGLIFARAGKLKNLETGLKALFETGKNTSDNKLLRFMKHYIFGNKKEMLQVLSSEKQNQGLMQVYQDFCTQNENNCLKCQFPDVVNKHFS